MQFALIDNSRAKPQPKTHGFCQYCGTEMISKCGSKKRWHWAHASNQTCDRWWENETHWHREWKSCFPEHWRECIHEDPTTKEKHIADVKTDDGLVLEFQNSPIPPCELKAREEFYDNLIWVVNGQKFAKRFHILDPLPHPDSTIAQNFVFHRQRLGSVSRASWRDSESVGGCGTQEVLDAGSLEERICASYVGHHLFHWQNPRTVWFEASKQVYFDFADQNLYLLCRYDDRGLMSVQKHRRIDVVASWTGTPPSSEPCLTKYRKRF